MQFDEQEEKIVLAAAPPAKRRLFKWEPVVFAAASCAMLFTLSLGRARLSKPEQLETDQKVRRHEENSADSGQDQPVVIEHRQEGRQDIEPQDFRISLTISFFAGC
jgi:hypothetical protein